MTEKKINLKKQDTFEFPFLKYVGAYAITKFFDYFKSLSFLLDNLETKTLNNEIDKLSIDRPIYVTGVARAGTTIILEMLNKHPDLATHQYKHLLIPYLPHWLNQIVKKTKIFTKSQERPHMDGMMITRDSPEVVEEIFWQKFFNNVHSEKVSNIMSRKVSNPDFEKFYRTHIRKLIINQKCSRFLTKNNYNITRLEYLLRIFPSSKFLVIIRNPVDQIASLIKQTRLFMNMVRKKPLLTEWLRMIGHHEFGYHQVCINVDNTELILKIRKLWRNKKTFVKGWAYYWSSIYDFVANQLDVNNKLKEATLIVKYDDLCETPSRVIDKILEHTELPKEKFTIIKKYYIKHLHKPSYYYPNFSNQEYASISKITKATAARFGL